MKLEYQFTRSIFLRAVGEYDLTEQSDLRDETRTFYPLIINGKKALATRSAQLHGDWLFSYQPSPGTVLFLGYGSQANATANPLDRVHYPAAGPRVGLLLREVQLSASGCSGCHRSLS